MLNEDTRVGTLFSAHPESEELLALHGIRLDRDEDLSRTLGSLCLERGLDVHLVLEALEADLAEDETTGGDDEDYYYEDDFDED
jgi:hypothetical protein